MQRRSVFIALGATILTIARGDGRVAALLERTASHPEPQSDCKQMASTGRAVARRCANGRTEAHVDNRNTVHIAPYPPRFRHLPIDRLRARGQGKIHATGDKGARAELHRKASRKA